LPIDRRLTCRSAALTFMLLAAMPALAQQTPPQVSSTETITVTGSRLAPNNATSDNPITVVTSEEIARSSAQTIEDVLQKLPSIGTNGIYATTNNGGEGISCTDFRNLGISRVLVLVNGRRFVHSGIFGVDCVDLNNIPVSMIERIEVLKDGASSIYGADAVSGVINIILKKNFDGSQIDLGGDITGHGDGKTGEIDGTSGFSTENGSIMLNAGFLDRGPVPQADRAFAAKPLQDNAFIINANGQRVPDPTFGAPFPNGGEVFDGPLVPVGSGVIDPNGVGRSVLALGNGQFRTFNPFTDNIDFGQQQYLVGTLEKESLNAIGRYDFLSNLDGFLQGFYTHKETDQQLGPQPLTGGFGAGLPDEFIIPKGNPFNPFGEDVSEFKNALSSGDRLTVVDTDTAQFTGGFDGTLPGGFDWSTWATYGFSDNTIDNFGEINFQKLEEAVGFRQTNPAVPDQGVYDPTVCNPSTGCSLINPFGPNSISTAQARFFTFLEKDHSEFTLAQVGANVKKDDVYDLPYGPFGLDIGAEFRREAGSYTPDPLVQSGVTLENPQEPTKGSFNVAELYAEGRVPILADLPFAKELTATASGRFYDYNTFGTGATWKAGGIWSPIDDIRFRGNIGTAFRQPEINELFGGQALSFNSAIDPCDAVERTTFTGQAAVNVAANCAKLGIPTDFRDLNGGQIKTITGGNPALQPETAESINVGVVIEPRFLPDLAVTTDYFRTKIQHSIGSVGTSTILDQCFTSVNLSDPLCANIGPRLPNNQLNLVTAIEQNLGVTRTDGIDIGTTYHYDFAGFGRVSLESQSEILFNFEQQNFENGPFQGFAGLINTGLESNAFPRLRNNDTMSWSNDDLTLSYTLRYISGMGFFPLTDPAVNPATHTPGIFYSDIAATYQYDRYKATVGIDNLFDKQPPFVPDGSSNTAVSVYDLLGRLFYLKATVRF
jgi:iron complex outermembrane receptor protein